MPGSHRRAGIFVLQAPGLVPREATLDISELLPLWLEHAGMSKLLETPGEFSAEDGEGLAPQRLVETPGSLARRLRRLGYL